MSDALLGDFGLPEAPNQGEVGSSILTGIPESLPASEIPWSEMLEEMQASVMHWVKSPVPELVRRFIFSSDAARSYVNVHANIPVGRPASAAAGGGPRSHHLLMQTLAVPFDCSDKVGADLFWPDIANLNVLMMASTEVGTGWASTSGSSTACIIAEAHHSKERHKSEIGVCKACCGGCCPHQVQAGCCRANLRGKLDSPARGRVTYEACGWNENGLHKNHRLAMFGSASKTTSQMLGIIPHTLLSQPHMGLCHPRTGSKVRKGASGKGDGCIASRTQWNVSFGNDGYPEVRDIWKVMPFWILQDTVATATDVVEAMRVAAEPGWQTSEHHYKVLPTIATWLLGGGVLTVSAKNTKGEEEKVGFLLGIVEFWCGTVQLHEMYYDYYQLANGFQPDDLQRNLNGFYMWKYQMLTDPYVKQCIKIQESDKDKGLDQQTYLFGMFKDTGNTHHILTSTTFPYFSRISLLL